jgi:uncharacterized membrane protein YciS (DUF1049 family)
MIFANGYIAASFVIGAVILGGLSLYAMLRLRGAARRLAALENPLKP